MHIIVQDVETTVFKPITLTLVIETQEEYDAIQLAGESLNTEEIKSVQGFKPYSYSERTVWVELLECVARETKKC
jgi:hypothetical protein